MSSPKGTKFTNGLPLSPKEVKVTVFISVWVRTECTLEEKENLRCIAGLEPGTMATLVFMHRSAIQDVLFSLFRGMWLPTKTVKKSTTFLVTSSKLKKS